VGAVGGRNFGLPIDLAHRLYNCLLLPHKPWYCFFYFLVHVDRVWLIDWQLCVGARAGASSGIGREVALACAFRGARLILACRNVKKTEAVSAYLKRKSGNDDVHYVIVDLASLESVRQLVDVCCQRQWTVDVLINNAGLRLSVFTRESSFSHRNSVCPSVCLSVTQVDQSKTAQARITKFSPSAA